MNLVVYIHRPPAEQGSGELGFDWGAIISQAIPTAVGVIGGLTAPKPPKPCTLQNVSTQGETALCCDQALNQWTQLIQTASPADQLAAAIAIRGMLAPPSFSPSNTNQYLVNTRAFFDDQIAQLKTATGIGNQVTPTGQTAAPTQTAVPTGETMIAGYSLTTVLAFAGIGLGLWAVAKQ